MARISVDLPEPFEPMTPTLSLSYAVKETPFSACTVRVLRLRCVSLRAVSSAEARLPVASTLYSTWTSSTTTAGRRASSGPSVGTAIALLGGPEVHGADDQGGERPCGGVAPVRGVDDVVGTGQHDAPREVEELVDGLPVGDPHHRLVLAEPSLDAEEDARRVEEEPRDEREQLGHVAKVHRQPGRDEGQPRVEHREQDDQRYQQQPVPQRLIAEGQDQHHHDHDHRDELQESLGHQGERQRHAREAQALHQVGVARDRLRARREAAGEVLEEEHADDEKQDELIGPAPGTDEDAEDRAVDGGIDERLEDDPAHAEPVAAVLGLDAEPRQRVDEGATLPDVDEIGADRRATTDLVQTFARRVFGETHPLKALSCGWPG